MNARPGTLVIIAALGALLSASSIAQTTPWPPWPSPQLGKVLDPNTIPPTAAPLSQEEQTWESLPPPPPGTAAAAALPDLYQELWFHGGSYLYNPEGDRWGWPVPENIDHACEAEGDPSGWINRWLGRHDADAVASAHYDLLRLPEDWREPRPWTAFAEFLGADPIRVYPRAKWPGPQGYVWEPRLVGYGGYSMFALAWEQGGMRRDLIGHQLIADLDLQLTGTERFHVQFRPLGGQQTGGSYFQLNQPRGYDDNANGIPNRYWFEGQVSSILGNYVDPFAPRDVTFVVGKFPFALHNALLINDEILGVVLSQNNIYLGNLSNLNVQGFFAWDDVDAYIVDGAQLLGAHCTADYKRTLLETTLARVFHPSDSSLDRNYAAVSATMLVGRSVVAGRLMGLWDDHGRENGWLAVLEANRTDVFERTPLGFEYGVAYCNLFWASPDWRPISGANFNRLRTAFEVNPLIRLSAGPAQQDTVGVAIGWQLFRNHENSSLIPEAAFEAPQGQAVWGIGLRYLHKTGPRTYLELLGIGNFSADPSQRREGVFAQHVWVF